MAIIYANGFEDGPDSQLVEGSTIGYIPGAGRRGGTAYGRKSITGGDISAVVGLPAFYSTLFFAFAWMADNSNAYSGSLVLAEFREATLTHIKITANTPDGSIRVIRGSTTIYTSPAGVLPGLGEYAHIAIKVVISDTVGSVEIRKNGETTPSVLLSGIDTRNAGSGVITNVLFSSYSTGSPRSGSVVDDLVVWDTSGSVNNNWLGDVRVDSYMPTADGDTTTMTPSSGSAHWALVDEVPQSTSDYVHSSTVGSLDLFQMADMAHTPSTVHAVIPFAVAGKNDAGSREIAIAVKSGATSSDGPNVALSTSAGKTFRVLETDPATSAAWTKSGVDALQAGVKVTV